MKRFIFLTAVLLCAACSIEEQTVFSEVEGEKPAAKTDGQFYSGVVTVKFTEDMAALIGGDLGSVEVATRADAVGEFAQKYGITSFKRIFKDDPRWTERHQREGLHLWYKVTFDPDAVTATKAAGDIASDPSVVLAEPCRVKKLNTVNDPYYSLQWQLNGQYGVNVEGAWEYTTGDPAVIVAVNDGGIIGHPDIDVLPGGEGMSWNFVYENSDLVPEEHGVFCGGLISAMTNNEIGVAGVAGGDYSKGKAGVTLMSCQIIVGDDWGEADEALVYSADNGVLISSNSWGYGYGSEEDAANAETPESDKVAIDYFNKYAGCDNNGDQLPNSKMKGGLVLFASGNDGWAHDQPAEYEGCIAVSATESDGTRASYSNYGDWVDICAPGTSVCGAAYFSDSSSFDYGYGSGTSFSCPITAGVAALAVSYYGGYGFTADDLKTCLLEGANHDIVFDKPIGPLADALGTLTYYTLDPPQDVTSYSVTAMGDRLTFTWNVPAGNSRGTAPAYGMLLCASTDKSAIDNLDPRSVDNNVISCGVITEDYAVGEEVSEDIFTEQFSTTFYVTCVPYNRGISYGNVAETKTVETTENHAPTITTDTDLSNIEVRATGNLYITFTIEDPDGHDFTVTHEDSFIEGWTVNGGGEYTLSIHPSRTDSNGNYADTGKHTAIITAVDSYEAETVLEVNYTILDNESPIVTNTFDNVTLTLDGANSSADFYLNDYFADPDGDALTYSVSSSSEGVAHAYVTTDTSMLTIMAMGLGTADVTVSARDARSLSCSQTIPVTVRGEEGGSSAAVSVYPNPCSDVLYVSIDTAVATSTEIAIYSSTGSLVYSKAHDISASNPATIDVSSLAPGRYSVKVSYDNVSETKNVVKI